VFLQLSSVWNKLKQKNFAFILGVKAIKKPLT